MNFHMIQIKSLKYLKDGIFTILMEKFGTVSIESVIVYEKR